MCISKDVWYIYPDFQHYTSTREMQWEWTIWLLFMDTVKTRNEQILPPPFKGIFHFSSEWLYLMQQCLIWKRCWITCRNGPFINVRHSYESLSKWVFYYPTAYMNVFLTICISVLNQVCIASSCKNSDLLQFVVCKKETRNIRMNEVEFKNDFPGATLVNSDIMFRS